MTSDIKSHSELEELARIHAIALEDGAIQIAYLVKGRCYSAVADALLKQQERMQLVAGYVSQLLENPPMIPYINNGPPEAYKCGDAYE